MLCHRLRRLKIDRNLSTGLHPWLYADTRYAGPKSIVTTGQTSS